MMHTFRNECYELPWLDGCSLCPVIRYDNSCHFLILWAMNYIRLWNLQKKAPCLSFLDF